MNKVISVIVALMATFNAFAIGPAGARIDRDGGMDIPTPILIIGLIIATIGCFALGLSKNKDGKRDSSGMIWLGFLGVVGLIIAFNHIC